VTISIEDLLRDHPVIDGHNDLLWAMRDLNGYDFAA
jgi:membrane dipeptidase